MMAPGSVQPPRANLLETTRDVVIIVFGITATAATLLLTAMAVLAFRKLDRILDSVQNTARAVEAVATPIARATALIGSAWKIVSGMFTDGEKRGRDDAT